MKEAVLQDVLGAIPRVNFAKGETREMLSDHGPARPLRRTRRFALACGLCVVTWVHAQAVRDLGFTTRVSPGLTTQLAQKFSGARPLLSQWLEFAAAQRSSSFNQRLGEARGRE